MKPLRAPLSEGADYDLPSGAARLLTHLRAERTRVHAITNAAAQVLTANLLLAAGGTPSLTTAPDEVADFARRAGALLVNLGTLDRDRRAAIPEAIAAARGAGRPWVLDPVFVDASPPRLAFARANGTVLAVTGAADVVTDGRRELAVANGHPLMSRVTAMGCAGGALAAAFAALEPDAFQAAAAALLVIGVAG